MTDNFSAHFIFFSPTGTSAKVGKAIAKGMGFDDVKVTDLTCDESTDLVSVSHEVAIIAVPVYGGRVAPLAMKRLQRLQAEHAPVVLVAVYGNRDYEDALVELRDFAVEKGFTPLSAGAFIGEHSFSTEQYPVAVGRPDQDDLNLAIQLGADSVKKLQAGTIDSIGNFFIKGNRPYKSLKASAPVSPVSNERCNGCATCLDVCPTHAISIDEAGQVVTVAEKCIKCCACVKVCPEGARIFDTPFSAFLHQNCSARRAPEIFI